MKNKKRMFCFLILPFLLGIAGCSIPRHYVQPDPTNPIKTIAVLPMVNHTNDIEGPERVREMFAAQLPERCYMFKPAQEVNQILKDELGITLGSQLDMTNPEELGKKLDVDGVVYGDLYDFNEKTTGVLNVRRVRAGFKLVDTKTGQTVWGRGQGVKSVTKMTKGDAGKVADIASGVGKIQDKGEKMDVGTYAGLTEWYELPEKEAYGQQHGIVGAFAAGLAEKAIKKVAGTFLERESQVAVDMITDTLTVGPGSERCGGPVAAVQPLIIPMPEILTPKMPEFSVPAYFEFGKRDFTAIMIMTSVMKSNNEKWAMDARIAKLGDKFRSDVDMAKALKAKGGEMPPGFGRNIFITRPDLKLDYIVYPEKKKYLELTVTEEEADKPKIEKRKIGSETIDGHPCDKYEIKITYKDGTVEDGLLWEAKDLDRFVIRAEMENKDAKSVVELKNVKLVSPPKSLFEIPQGFVKAASMMEIFMEQKPAAEE